MPDGKTHYKYYSRVGYPLLLAIDLPLMFLNWKVAIGDLLGYFLHLFVDPDLDQIGISRAEGRLMQTLGFFAAPWIMYWVPYALLFPHRGFGSHSPIISTLIRLGYLLITPTILIYSSGNPWWEEWWMTFLKSEVLLGIFIGLSRADFIHIWLDMNMVKKNNRYVLKRRING